MELENIILNEFSQAKKTKSLTLFSQMWNIDPIQTQAILRKTGYAKGRSHMRKREENMEVKKMNMVDVLPIQE
jgi:hypothetical protein